MKSLLIICLFLLQQNLSNGQVNVFIGQTKTQIKNFWSTKISSVYFKDTEEEAFVIMVGDAGPPEFQAIFDEKGKCTSHQTKISFNDISVVIARLKKANYKLVDNTDTWVDVSKKISCKINHYGLKDYYSFDFQIAKNEKTKSTKKTAEEIALEKEELNKITTFAKSIFGANSNCSVTTKIGNCCGYECSENVFLINDGIKDVISISTFGAICDGKEHVKARFLGTNVRSNGNSLEMIFNKIKEEINSNNSNQINNKTDESKAETIINVEQETEIFTVVEEMPEYIGGQVAMGKFIEKNLQYPKFAKDKGISGKCFMKFVITPDGNIGNILVLKGVPGCKECDEEAIRLIKSMPSWKPGKQNGKPVAVWYNFPLNFRHN